MRAKDAVGGYGERVAARHLADAGLEILAHNWRRPDGEVDVVAREGTVLVFCEVKCRSGVAFGVPAEAVNAAKARRIRRLACRWLEENGRWPGEIRFDVVSVLVQQRGAAVVEHLRGAF